MGFEPIVQFDGPVDSLVDDEVATHVLAVVQEALSNVTRHAHATRVEVSLVIDDGQLVVTVADDGRGIDKGISGGRGIDNMRVRASRLGGEVEWERGPIGGTTFRWCVPVK
jgi:signal transduction histidine kinase